jgi:hypothetical protein
MNAMRRHQPSPAVLIALLALLVALGGTSYAAVTLPKNSVGTTQLRKHAVARAKLAKGAVTGAKVKDGSLTAADFGAGQLPAGPRGPQGPTGLRGTTGPKGERGLQGVPGLSEIESISADTVEDSLGIKTVQLTCPVGKIVIDAGAEVARPVGSVSLLPVALDASTAVTSRIWVVGAHELENTAENWGLRGRALCAKVG